MFIKLKIHSIVDVITNSSTVIFIYQDSVKEAKELVQEVLNLAGIVDKTPDDVFYYGVFCDENVYSESVDLPENCPKINRDLPYDERYKPRREWLNDLKLSIMKREMDRPSWMKDAEDGGDVWSPGRYLYLYPKDKQFESLANKISKLLGSIHADGGSDG